MISVTEEQLKQEEMNQMLTEGVQEEREEGRDGVSL